MDTTIYLYKFSGTGRDFGSRPVFAKNKDSADFIRVIPPFNSTDLSVEVSEYYKNGVLKFKGAALTKFLNLRVGDIDLDGACIDFFPTGKRRSVSNYKAGIMDGLQYYYYPEGKLCEVVKYTIDKDKYSSTGVLMDFYDKDGVQICKDGNGRAIQYGAGYYKIREGAVKDGKMEGGWRGYLTGKDSAKFVMIYKNDVFKTGIGYDAAGKAYPFKDIYLPARLPLGIINFVVKFKKDIKLPKGSAVTKKMIDSVQLYFLVEKDGGVSHFETVEPVLPELMEALKLAFKKCPKWEPARYYGIPLQSQVAISLKIIEPILGYSKDVKSYQQALYNGLPLEDLPVIRTGGGVF